VDAIVDQIYRLKQDVPLQKRWGRNGRYYFEAHSERLVCCEQWEFLLNKILR
jgi:hypothetical protein